MAPNSPLLRSTALSRIVSGALFVGTVLLFTRALGYDFLNYDDPSYLTNNARVQAGLTWDSFVWAFTGRTDYWHPLTWLSHMLDWQLFGEWAPGHRAVSLLWHALNAVLVFNLLRRLTGTFWTCALAAALFAWHPLRVESVVWVTERKDVMSGSFFLLTLSTYQNYARRIREGQPARKHYVLSLALFLAGLMCKPMVVSLPLVLLILDAWPLGRFAATAPGGSWWRNHRCVFLEKLPFFALSGVISVVTMLMQLQHGAFVLQLPLADRLGNAIVSVIRYLGNFFWPADLVVCYPHPGHWPILVVFGAAILVAILSVVAWRQRRTQPWMLCGWSWFVVMLLPALGVVQVGFQAMADRYTYLPIIGWQLALLWTLRNFRFPRIAAIVASAAVLVACVVATWRQQGVWRDSVSLFQHAIAVDDTNHFAHGFLGYTFLELDRPDEALLHASRALDLAAHNAVARYTLAAVQEQRREFVAAEANLRLLLAENPFHVLGRNLHGIVLVDLGRAEEAVPELQIAFASLPQFRESGLTLAHTAILRGQPAGALPYVDAALANNDQDADARIIRARALDALGRKAEALMEANRLLQQHPDHLAAHTLAGLILTGSQRAVDALPHFKAVLAKVPNDVAALTGAARSLEQLGQRDEATAVFQQALAAGTGVPEVHRAWGDVLARRGDFAGAIQEYEKVIALRPTDAEGHVALGFALVLSGRRQEAANHWREALRLRPDFPDLSERLRKLPP